MNNLSLFMPALSTRTTAPAVITKAYVLLMLSTIASNTCFCTLGLRLATKSLPAPAIAAWISERGTVGSSSAILSWEPLRKTEFAMASAIVTPVTCAQVINPTADETFSGSTIACATEKEAWANRPVPKPIRML